MVLLLLAPLLLLWIIRVISQFTWLKLVDFLCSVICCNFSDLHFVLVLRILFFLQVAEILHHLAIRFFILTSCFASSILLKCAVTRSDIAHLLLAIHLAWSAWTKFLLLSTLHCEVAGGALSSAYRSSCYGSSWGLSSEWALVLVEHVALVHVNPGWVLGRVCWSRQRTFETDTLRVYDDSIGAHFVLNFIWIVLIYHNFARTFIVQAFLLENLCNW